LLEVVFDKAFVDDLSRDGYQRCIF